MSLVIEERPAPRILRLIMNRPEKRNALSPELRDALTASVKAALVDPEVRVLILTGAERTFSAGGDLSTLDGIEPAAARQRLQLGHAFVRMLLEAEKPVIAAVEGHAMGAAVALALSADSIVIGEGTTIGFPFLKVGLVPDFGISYLLPRRIGLAAARQAILQSRNFKGPEAVAFGLADEIVEDGEVQARALALAERMSALPPRALGLARRMFMHQPPDFAAAAEMETLMQTQCLSGSEFVEGLAAFREKRPPRFE